MQTWMLLGHLNKQMTASVWLLTVVNAMLRHARQLVHDTPEA